MTRSLGELKVVMALYRFHWLDGKIEDGKGQDVSDAFNRLGYGGGAIAALDYYETVRTVEADETQPT